MTKNLVMVLAHSHEPRDLGHIAQAAGAFGINRLVLVGCKIKIDQIAMLAAGGSKQPALDSVPYEDWATMEKAEGPGRFVLAHTEAALARSPTSHEPISSDARTYLILCPSTQLARAQKSLASPEVLKIPNLRMADENLNLIATLALQMLATATKAPDAATPTPSHHLPQDVVDDWLHALNMDQHKDTGKAQMLLQKILVHPGLSERELSLLEAVLQQTVRKLKRPSS